MNILKTALVMSLISITACGSDTAVDNDNNNILIINVDVNRKDFENNDAGSDASSPEKDVEDDTQRPSVLDPNYENTSTINLPKELDNYANPVIPPHFEVESERFHNQQPLISEDNTPADNPTTDAGATLGRVLFYDPNLSINQTVACASCHKAEFGFSDDKVLSEGFDKRETGRHSMGLTNARFYRNGKFFWDQRAATLEDQVLMPLQDEVEMGMTLELVVARVEDAKYYPELFQAAFGSTEVSEEKISKALAQFVRSMVSSGSRYDEGRALVASRRTDFPNFTTLENKGKFLFSNPPPRGGFGCFVCHQGEGFIGVQATSNGLDADVSSDLGYGKVVDQVSRNGHFKVPSLRNIAVRPPFMHDGRFSNLDEVIEHYSTGVQASPNLQGPLFAGRQFNMTEEEKKSLVAFLKTLTDEEMLKDPKFSDPFTD